MSVTRIMALTENGDEEEEEELEENELWEGDWNTDWASRSTLSDEVLRNFRVGYAASKLDITGNTCLSDDSIVSHDTLVRKLAHERVKLAHFKGTERRLSLRSAISEDGKSIWAPTEEFPDSMPLKMRQAILSFYAKHSRYRRESEVIPDTEGFFTVANAKPHQAEGPLQDANEDKYRSINRREDAYNPGGYIDDKMELQRVAGANRAIWGTRRHTDGYVKFLYHEALGAERDRVWRKVPTMDDFTPTIEEVMAAVPVDELLPSHLDLKCLKSGKQVWWADPAALEKGSKETIQVIRHIHNKIQEIKTQRFEEFMETYQAEYKSVKFFDLIDTEQPESSKAESSSDESYILKPEPPFFIDESKLEEEDRVEEPWRSTGLYDVHKDSDPPTEGSSSEDSQKTLRSLISMRSSRGTSRMLKKKMFTIPSPLMNIASTPDRFLVSRTTAGSRLTKASGSYASSIATGLNEDDEDVVAEASMSTVSSYGEEYFAKIRDRLLVQIEEHKKAAPKPVDTGLYVSAAGAHTSITTAEGDSIPAELPEKDDELQDDSSNESYFLINQEMGEEEEEELGIEPPPVRAKRYASPFLNAISAKGNKPKDDSLFSIQDALEPVIEILPVQYEPYQPKRPPFNSYDDYLDVKKLVTEVAAPYEAKDSEDVGDDEFPMVTREPVWQRIQKRCHRMRERPDRLIQVYKCMCRRLGVPAFELVARALYSKTANFTRMGRAPPGALRVAFTMLERNNRLQQIYLTGLSLVRDDVLHLNSLLQKAIKIQRLLLANTKLGPEHLNILRDTLKDMPNLCFLDLSSNRLGDKGLVQFLRGIGEITNITTLVLKNNGLSSACLPGFKSLLGNWTSITSLDLSWNEINEGQPLNSFANFVVRHETMALKELRVAWNGMEGNSCAQALFTLANIPSMKYLDISFNNFSTETEMAIFNNLLHQASSLEFFIMQDNPIRGAPVAVLLSDLGWTTKPNLKLIDLGDIWLDKVCAQNCNDILNRYGVLIKFSQVEANYDIGPPDMRKIYIQRTQFLNKKTRKKNLGQMLLKLEYKKKLLPMRRSEFYELLEKTKLKMDEGLDTALARAFIQRGRVNVVQMLRMYMELYPNTKFLGAKKKKKKKKKKGKKGSSDDEISQIEDDTPDPNLRELWKTRHVEKPSKMNARFLGVPGAEEEEVEEEVKKEPSQRTAATIILDVIEEGTIISEVTTETATTEVTANEDVTTEATTEYEKLTEAASEEVTSVKPEDTTTTDAASTTEADSAAVRSTTEHEDFAEEATTVPNTATIDSEGEEEG